MSAQEDLLKLLFPTEIVEYFDLIKVEEVEGTLNFHLEELNLAPSGYLQAQLESKGLDSCSGFSYPRQEGLLAYT